MICSSNQSRLIYDASDRSDGEIFLVFSAYVLDDMRG